MQKHFTGSAKLYLLNLSILPTVCVARHQFGGRVTILRIQPSVMYLLAVMAAALYPAAYADAATDLALSEHVTMALKARDWNIQRDRYVGTCWQATRRTSKAGFSAIRICAREGSPSTALEDFGFFREDDHWKAAGAFELHDATVSLSGHNVVLRGRVECGIKDRGMQHAARGECEKAIVVGESAAATIETDGRKFSNADFSEVLLSIRVSGKAPPDLLLR